MPIPIKIQNQLKRMNISEEDFRMALRTRLLKSEKLSSLPVLQQQQILGKVTILSSKETAGLLSWSPPTLSGFTGKQVSIGLPPDEKLLHKLNIEIVDWDTYMKKNPDEYQVYLADKHKREEANFGKDPWENEETFMKFASFALASYVVGTVAGGAAAAPLIRTWMQLNPGKTAALKQFMTGALGEAMVDINNPMEMVMSGAIFAGIGGIGRDISKFVKQSGLKQEILGRLLKDSKQPIKILKKAEKKLGLKFPKVNIKTQDKIAIDTSVTDKQITLNITRAINKWQASTNEAAFDGKVALENWRKAIPNKNSWSAFLNQIEKGDRTSPDPTGKLSTERWTQLKAKYHLEFNYLWALNKKKGIELAYRDNYVYHIVTDKLQKIQQAFYPKGGKLGIKPGFTKPRTLEGTLLDLKERGLHPVEDPGLIQSAYRLASGKAQSNKALIDTLRNITDAEGIPIIENFKKAPSNYKFINNSAFSHYLYAGQVKKGGIKLIKMPDKVHPKWAKDIENLVIPSSSMGTVETAYKSIRNNIKRVIMYNPLIHGVNILSDIIDETNFNLIKTFKLFKTGTVAWKNKTDLVRDAIRHGVNITDAARMGGEINRGLKLVETTNPMVFGKIKGSFLKLRQWNDEILWGKIVRSAQLGLYQQKVGQFTKDGLAQEEAKELAGQYVNNMLGTLPRHVFTNFQREATSALFFARNWTISNLRLVTGALGKAGSSPLIPKMLRHEGLSDAQLVVAQKHYVEHIGKGIFALITTSNLFQAMFQAANDQPITSTFTNEEGHKLDIDTGLRREDGRKIYMKNWLFRYIGDLMGWTTEPLKTFYNKLEPLLKITIEEAINYEVWKRKEIASTALPLGTQLKERAKHILTGALPTEAIMGREGQIREPMDVIAMVTGTWIRHGVAGGDYAKDMIEFRIRKSYEDEKTAVQMKKMISKGDIIGAATYGLENNKWSTISGLNNLIQKYLSPLNYKFQGLSKRDKVYFIKELQEKYGSDSKENFLKALEDERQYAERKMKLITESLEEME